MHYDLMRSDSAPLKTLALPDTSTFTELRLSLTTPPGRPLILRTRADSTEAQNAVDLTWILAGTSPLDLAALMGDADVGVRLELGGYSLEADAGSNDDVANLTAAERELVLLSENRFRASSVVVDAAGGVIRVVSTYSLLFRRGVVFSSATLVLLMPTGLPSSGGAGRLDAGARQQTERGVRLSVLVTWRPGLARRCSDTARRAAVGI